MGLLWIFAVKIIEIGVEGVGSDELLWFGELFWFDGFEVESLVEEIVKPGVFAAMG